MALDITKILSKYIPSIFITLSQEESEWLLRAVVLKNGVIQEKFSKNFEQRSEDVLPSDMREYINKLQTEYNFAYIALFLDSMGQGAICGKNASDFDKNSVDVKNVSHFDIDQAWSVYASFIDINWTKKLFAETGLDFIYSPFVLQYDLVSASKLAKEPVLYILNLQNSITISIFEEKRLQFGAFFRINSDDGMLENDDMSDWQEEEETQTLEELEDENEPEEFTPLGELEAFDGHDESQGFIDTSEEQVEEEQSLSLFGRDVLVYKYLTSSLKEYYQNPIYESDFVEKIVIHDGFEVSPDLIEMLENDLFLDVQMSKIDLHERIYKLAKDEVLQ